MKIGDKVEWTQIKTRGLSIQLKQRYGTILELSEDGQRARVKSGKQTGMISIDKLHVTGSGQNQLTKLIYESGAR